MPRVRPSFVSLQTPSPGRSTSEGRRRRPCARAARRTRRRRSPARFRARARRRHAAGRRRSAPCNEARMCVGAFSSPSSMMLPRPAVLDHALERRLEIARDGRVGVLVDRHACRRVRHVDEHRGPSWPATASRTSCVMSRSWSGARSESSARARRRRRTTGSTARRRRRAGHRPRAGSRHRTERCRYSSTSRTLSRPRSTIARSADIDETSSRCSCRNQCRNCSPTSSPSSRASLTSSTIWSVTRFSWASASATGARRPRSRSAAQRRPGSMTSLVGVEEVLDHHHRVVSLLDRLAVEVGGEQGSVSPS